MPTRDDWPRDDFLTWLEGLKAPNNLRSDNQLAEFLGIGHTLISAWKGGRQKPSIDTLTGVAKTLGIDPRPLWVLAGLVDAQDVGLSDEDSAVSLESALPQEFDLAAEVYKDPRMSEDDRRDLRRQLRLFALGMLAELDERAPAEQPKQPRRRSG